MGKGYTSHKKAMILREYQALRQAGKTAQEAAKGVKVSYVTLLRWEKEFQPTQADQSTNLVLTTPDGFRIESDDPKQLAQLLNQMR